ncbi:conserved oligomeric Golgi complex subunit 6 [Rhipicephalus sanguineus]|uniref:conserved oligomeric Golgi complex subunit 6 n=1 Tax=Rhipicephalus sanguineus TaxID=34632 RepID=UPI0020C23A00|nr:conserved oligomeric Golgi complex subunit 6 [Rhipicephalus sanguineus]
MLWECESLSPKFTKEEWDALLRSPVYEDQILAAQRALSKCLTETIGNGYKATKMATGDLLVEVKDKSQYQKLTNLVAFGDKPITVTAHRTMNTVKGVVSDDDLMDLTDDELLAGWKDKNVVQCVMLKSERLNSVFWSLQQETAYERLYRWLQNRCRVLGADAASEPGPLLARAFGALRERPLLWGYALDEYANARRACVVRHLIDALTRGTGGSRPLESLAKDPLRYAGDMLAWAHQCAASERELLEQLLAQCGGLRGSGGSGEAALDHILAGLCSPLRLRLEQLAVAESSPLVLCRLRSVVRFYSNTLGSGTALAICLDEVAALAHKMFLNSLTCHCTRLLDKAELPPGDLGAPPFLQQLLSLVRELLSTRDGSLAPVDQRQKDLPDILAQVLEPALAACEQLSSRLAPADRSVHLLNCLQLAQTGLAVLEMTEPWLEELEARQKPHINCLVEEQLEHFVSRLGSALADDPSRSGSIVPLPEPLSLQALSQGLAELCEQLEAWGTLPPLALLVGRQRQQAVRRAALDKLWHRYVQLYMRVHAATDKDLAERLPLAPDTLREALLLPPLTQQGEEQDGGGSQEAPSST